MNPVIEPAAPAYAKVFSNKDLEGNDEFYLFTFMIDRWYLRASDAPASEPTDTWPTEKQVHRSFISS